MLERYVRGLVGILQKNGLISTEEQEEFIYVLLGDVETLFIIISILGIGILVGQPMPTISFLICFFSLRRKTGGYHLASFGSCYVGTVCLYVFIIAISYFVVLYEEMVMTGAGIAGIIIFCIGSVNHPNMDLEEKEFQELKTRSRIVVIFELLAVFFMKWLGITEMIITYSCMAIILCAALLLIAKLLGQEVEKL